MEYGPFYEFVKDRMPQLIFKIAANCRAANYNCYNSESMFPL